MMLPGFDDRSAWERARDRVDDAARYMDKQWRKYGDRLPTPPEYAAARAAWRAAMAELIAVEKREKRDIITADWPNE